jgi:hypothetical protein
MGSVRGHGKSSFRSTVDTTNYGHRPTLKGRGKETVTGWLASTLRAKVTATVTSQGRRDCGISPLTAATLLFG